MGWVKLGCKKMKTQPGHSLFFKAFPEDWFYSCHLCFAQWFAELRKLNSYKYLTKYQILFCKSHSIFFHYSFHCNSGTMCIVFCQSEDARLSSTSRRSRFLYRPSYTYYLVGALEYLNYYLSGAVCVSVWVSEGLSAKKKFRPKWIKFANSVNRHLEF